MTGYKSLCQIVCTFVFLAIGKIICKIFIMTSVGFEFSEAELTISQQKDQLFVS